MQDALFGKRRDSQYNAFDTTTAMLKLQIGKMF